MLILCGILCAALHINAQSCVSVDAGPDDTICINECTGLNANITGTRASTSYTKTVIPYAPYSFTGGTPVLANLDDVWSPVINIPFCFEFYGTVYTQIVIGTNGVATFDVSQASGNCPWTINTSAPSPGLPLNSIMTPFQDIDPTIQTSGGTSINWNVYGTAPCRVFVINWNNIAMYGNGCDTLLSTSQAVLHESTNIIDIFIREKNICGSWNNSAAIEGLQNANGTLATIPTGRNYPILWTAANDGVQFAPAGTPNYTVQWTDPSNIVIGTSWQVSVCPTQTTTYTVQVVNTSCNGNPVILTDQITVVVIPTTLTATSTYVLPGCFGNCNGSITILPLGQPPYTYQWAPTTNGGQTATGLCAGVYNCLVTDASGCSVNVTTNLITPPPFTATAVTTPSSCTANTGTGSISVIGGTAPFTYLWIATGDTTANVSNYAPGTYLVIVNDSAGCPDTLVAVIQMDGLQLTGQVSNLLCYGDCNATATITPSSGSAPYTYQWLPSTAGSAATATGLCSGNYACTATDSTGCQSTFTFNIVSPQPLVISPSSNITICFGQSTLLTSSVTGGTAPYTYAWSNNLPNTSTNQVTPTVTTIYTVTVTDANGCVSAPQQTLVKVIEKPNADFTATAGACPPSTIWFTNLTDSAVSYQWNFGDPASGSSDTSSLASPSHIYNSGGNYTITLIAINAYGCSDTLIIANGVTVLNAPDAGISPGTQLLTTLDPTTVFSNQTTGGSWYFIAFGDGDTMSTASFGPYAHTYDSVGIYTVMLISWGSDGCVDTAWSQLRVEDPTTLYVPNAFTPNGDGNNDVFMVYGINVSEFDLLVFDRWGNLLFETHDMSHGWNGTYKDEKCQQDVYVWRLNYTDIFGNRYKRIGHVSLVR